MAFRRQRGFAFTKGLRTRIIPLIRKLDKCFATMAVGQPRSISRLFFKSFAISPTSRLSCQSPASLIPVPLYQSQLHLMCPQRSEDGFCCWTARSAGNLSSLFRSRAVSLRHNILSQTTESSTAVSASRARRRRCVYRSQTRSSSLPSARYSTFSKSKKKSIEKKGLC